MRFVSFMSMVVKNWRGFAVIAFFAGCVVAALVVLGIVIFTDYTPGSASAREARPAATGQAVPDRGDPPRVLPGTDPAVRSDPAVVEPRNVSPEQLAQFEQIEVMVSKMPNAPDPATSDAFPPIRQEARQQQELMAAAFFEQLYTVDYVASSRKDLLAWAQAMSAPLTMEQVPYSPESRRKILFTSLVNAWNPDDPSDPPAVPTRETWELFRQWKATSRVDNVQVTTAPAVDGPGMTYTYALPTFFRQVSGDVTYVFKGEPERYSLSMVVAMTLIDGELGVSGVSDYTVRPYAGGGR